nr:phosphatidylcholine synthase [Actinomyces sp. UMB0138]
MHFFTMTGLLWALLAITALYHGQVKLMWMWLGISLIVDAADGPMSRKAEVTKVVPWFSGVMMDNVVDYLTWTFVPAIFMTLYLPLGPKPLPVVAAALALGSSMFCYCNTKMKSSDWYFVGFPAAWNIVAIILWLFQTPALFNWLVIVVFTVLAVVPWKWVHPFRVKRLRALNATAAVVWVATTAYMTVIAPSRPLWLSAAWLISGLWILAISAARTILGPSNR